MLEACKNHYWILLLCLLMETIQIGESVPAVTFGDQLDDGIAPSVCYPDDLPEDFGGNFTICAFVRPSKDSSVDISLESSEPVGEGIGDEDAAGGIDGIIFSMKYNQTFMEASFVNSKLMVTYGNKSFTFDATFEIDVWRRICIYYDPNDSKIETILGDFYIGQLEVSDANNDTESLDNFLCLGSANNTSTFIGAIAGVYVILWNETDENTIYFHETDCSNLIPEESFASLDGDWEVTGNASLFDYNPGKLCTEAFTPISIRKFAGHKIHLEICQSMNGRFITEGEVDDDLVQGITNATNSCIPVKEMLFWASGKTLGSGLRSLCPSVLVNGTTGNQPCISELNCSICLLPIFTPFTLYGKVADFDHSFTLLGLNNGNFYLKGKDTSEIHNNGSHWVISSQLHSNRLYLQDALIPSGRKSWQSEENFTLTITQCNRAQFACNNGDCIKRSSRCDGYEDCDHGEDERECDIIKLSRGYDREKSPGFGKTKQEPLYYSLSLYSISDIVTTEGMVTLDFLVYITWYEYRMQYWNLKSQTQNFPCETIWNPLVTAMAGYDDGLAFDLDTYDKKCGIYKDHPPKQLALDDHLMGEYLEGDQHYFYMEIYSRLTIPCNFKLHRYPFGYYVCNISMYLLNGREEMVFEKAYGDEDTDLFYEHSHDLLDFKLNKITYETLHDVYESIDYTNILVTLHLTSLYDYHVLNSFGPSSLIFLITFATFFFAIEDFNERIMVSLTSLLVLAALFSQASASSVKTPYYKLLDVWYAVLIALCFTAVIMIACVNALRAKKCSAKTVKVKPFGSTWCSKENLWNNPNRRAIVCNIISRMVLIILFIILVTVYISLASDVL